jgi:hypothetical protein
LYVLSPFVFERQATIQNGDTKRFILVKNRGKLRFIQKVESEDMLGPSEFS